jgi:uncharacterized protein (TIGR02270 family)
MSVPSRLAEGTDLVATSIREFNIELYKEHLEEASFLYEQRRTYLHDPEVNWPDLQDWEVLFEAHIDALVVGGDLALTVCRQQAEAGDGGELHAALSVMCRQKEKDGAFALLSALDRGNEDAGRAAADALAREAPTDWKDALVRALQLDQVSPSVLAHVIGYRRFPFEEVLTGKLAEKLPVGRAELAWALGRVGSNTSVPLLWSLVSDDDVRVCEAAAVALIRLGDERLLQWLPEGVARHPWVRRIAAIGGQSRCVRPLLDVLETAPEPDADAILALGLLGDLTAVGALVSLLGNDDLAEPAAVALNTITGARLYAEMFVAAEVDPDELFDDEREAYERDGEAPSRQGRPFGNWERRPVRDQSVWRSWLEENKHRFDRSVRWRMGQPYGPAALFDCLNASTTPYDVRRATYEELVVRYRLDVPFEADLPVAQQRQFLGRIQEWVGRQPQEFNDGRWYFGRQLMS